MSRDVALIGAAADDLRVGVDVGGTKVHAVLVAADGTVLGTCRRPTGLGPDALVESVAGAVGQLCADADVAPAALAGVGVGVPGIVDPGGGRVAHAVNLGITVPLALGPLLEARLGVPVTVENDLNAAVLGAAQVLGLSGDLAFLALGTGLAAGLVLDGALRRGVRGAAGEVGHVTYRPDGPVCRCGQRGCLELYASGTALDAAWRARPGAPVGGPALAEASPARPAPVEVFEAAGRGDRAAVAVRDSFADAVAAAVRVLVLTVDVEHVVLGGGVAAIGGPLLEAVRGACDRYAEGSPFLTSLDISARIVVTPSDGLVAPRGAAVTVGTRAHEREPSWRS
ncbi:MAG TPA: ROK family protein [Actinotalea sp.]|nr:ROK family protein [Actinotalea sp.]